jgi:hypothetical protein
LLFCCRVKRFEIDRENYGCLNTNDVTLLASTLKLFFRELPEPLISKEVNNENKLDYGQ